MFEVELVEDSGAGYQWDISVISGGATLLSQESRSIETSDESVGGPTHKVFLFKADRAGTIELEAKHHRAWLDEKPKIQKFKIDAG